MKQFVILLITITIGIIMFWWSSKGRRMTHGRLFGRRVMYGTDTRRDITVRSFLFFCFALLVGWMIHSYPDEASQMFGSIWIAYAVGSLFVFLTILLILTRNKITFFNDRNKQ